MDAEDVNAEMQQMNKKRRRLTGGDDDPVLDKTALSETRAAAEQVFKAAIAQQQANGCVWPNGCAVPMAKLTEEFPGYYWVVIRHQGNNFNIAQPAGHVYVMIMADFIALGYSRGE